MNHEKPQHTARRRTVLYCGAAAAGLGVAATGCSDADEPKDAATPSAPVELGAADAVPVGGAKLYREQRLLVAQPSEGEFTAFSAVCTHQGCVLDKVEGDEGNCSCHGSRFDVATGEVRQGPATSALPEVPVRVAGGRLIAGKES